MVLNLILMVFRKTLFFFILISYSIDLFSDDTIEIKRSIFADFGISFLQNSYPKYGLTHGGSGSFGISIGDKRSELVIDKFSKKSFCIRYHDFGNVSEEILADSAFNYSIVRKAATNNHFLEISKRISFGYDLKKIGLIVGYNYGLLIGGRRRTETRFYPEISDSASYNFAIVRNYSKGNLLSGFGITGGVFAGIVFTDKLKNSFQIHFFLDTKSALIFSQYNFIPNRIEPNETIHIVQSVFNLTTGFRIVFGGLF